MSYFTSKHTAFLFSFLAANNATFPRAFFSTFATSLIHPDTYAGNSADDAANDAAFFAAFQLPDLITINAAIVFSLVAT